MVPLRVESVYWACNSGQKWADIFPCSKETSEHLIHPTHFTTCVQIFCVERVLIKCLNAPRCFVHFIWSRGFFFFFFCCSGCVNIRRWSAVMVESVHHANMDPVKSGVELLPWSNLASSSDFITRDRSMMLSDLAKAGRVSSLFSSVKGKQAGPTQRWAWWESEGRHGSHL